MENRTMKEFIGEVFGTFILILLGDGVVANVGLAPRLAGTAYNWNTITIGWAFAVIIAVYVSAGVSGAHLNPAVTLGLAVQRWIPVEESLPLHSCSIHRCFPRRFGCLPDLPRRPCGFWHAQCVVHRSWFCIW